MRWFRQRHQPALPRCRPRRYCTASFRTFQSAKHSLQILTCSNVGRLSVVRYAVRDGVVGGDRRGLRGMLLISQ
eukprot:3640546-Pyramimonas_sp.AAC.1